MMFRPSESSEKIKEFYRRYLLTTFSTNRKSYNDQLAKALNDDKAIADGPYISMTDPYEKGKSLRELAAEGIVVKSILEIDDLHPDRPLYKHQETAVRKAGQNKNLIVTTGTGSGKTESFLIPVINQLLNEKENGTLNAGVRTLIIYPMNALVNDQIRRLRGLLKNTGITFGKFTGETEEELKRALIKYDGDKDSLLDNELICRKQMRDNPPNILITNYAMLEYMLLRPGDNNIFTAENAASWRYMVFDEAHSYTGSKGIEVSSLIARVKAMLKRDDIRFILTSATLGDERSDKEITEFGHSLCGAEFDPSCIIRSTVVNVKPERQPEPIPFDIYRSLAKIIDNNSEDDIIKEISDNGISIEKNKPAHEILYDLVLHDEFYYKVRQILCGKVMTLSELSSKLGMSMLDITCFIAVASSAHKNGEKLFEAKYHMFFKGIEGIFVTLPPSEKLFISRMENYETPDKDTYKVFEVSFCSNCNALFINGEEQDGKLVQRSKFSENYKPDVYLLNGEYDDDAEEEEELSEEQAEKEFQICSKCGQITTKTSLKGLTCGHGSKYINYLTKVKSRGEVLHQCPCCGSTVSGRSIIRPFYLGAEAATAVIATALYNELPSKEVSVETSTEIDLFSGEEIQVKNERETPKAKQFLAFSDSRQTAAFFAAYMQKTYNTALVKRVMQSICEEQKEKMRSGISFPEFCTMLMNKFDSYQLFDMKRSDLERFTWLNALKEMSNFKAKNSLTSLGMLCFEPDISLPNGLPGLTKEESEQLIKVLLRTMIKDGAVSSNVTFTDAEAAELYVSESLRGYNRDPSKNKRIIGFCPSEGKTNPRLKYIMKALGVNENDGRKYLKAIWDYLEKNKYMVKTTILKEQTFLLTNDKIRVFIPSTLYRCDSCRKVTPYNIKGICEGARCTGHLEQFDPSENEKNSYYRLYHDLDISSMKICEHTAQLSGDKAREYQSDFVNRKINVLSCSTTFEMGVDVGSLETVFMRNMPPSPSNYAQRAGRAGRSLNAAAYAVTFCANTSHDLNYYRHPVEMINGTIRPPHFNIENEKIVLRHIFSSAFSLFWRNEPVSYKRTIGEFIEINGFERFREYVLSKPAELKEYLKKSVPDSLQGADQFDIENFGWISKLFNADDKDPGFADIAVKNYEDVIKSFNDAIDYRMKKEIQGVDAIRRSIKTVKDQQMIEFLSKNNLIPKYGFPVDTVELQSRVSDSEAFAPSKLSLNRDLLTAISEYAPGSEIVADGKLITSRFIRRMSGYEWPQYRYTYCEKCETLNRSLSVGKVNTCRQCGTELKKGWENYIIPKFGFIMSNETPKPAGTEKPERTYRGSISYLGDEKKIRYQKFSINGMYVSIGTSRMDSLIVLNTSNFFICHNCGYGEVRDNCFRSNVECQHKNSGGYTCGNKMLYKSSLGHEFKTDVVFIKLDDYEIREESVGLTIMYSLLEGLSRSLNIDRNELSGCLQWYKDKQQPYGNLGIVLFDNTPGGAGYVRQIIDPVVLSDTFRYAYRVVKNCTCGGDLADTSCYSCLRNYYNQRQHDMLKRKYAIEFFETMMIENGNEQLDVHMLESNQQSDEEAQQEVTMSFEPDSEYEVKLLGRGMELSGNIAEEIWDYIIDDCNEQEETIINQISEKSPEHIANAIYGENIQLSNDQTTKQIRADLVWPDKKVMLFLSDSEDAYTEANKSSWICFSTNHEMDIDQLIKIIEVK